MEGGMRTEITPEDAMLSLYPPQSEPDWQTLDLDDDRWNTWFTPPVWQGPSSRCSALINRYSINQSTQQCSRRATSDLNGKPVCIQHHPMNEKKRRLNRLWYDRWHASKVG